MVVINTLTTAKSFHSFIIMVIINRLKTAKSFHSFHYRCYHQQTENSKKLSLISLSLLSSTVIDAKLVRGNVRRTGRMFPEHAERRFLHPEYSFVAARRILPTIFARQMFAQLRTNYIRRILPTMIAKKCSLS